MAWWQSIQEVGLSAGVTECTPGTAATNFLARTSGLSTTETNATCNLINGMVADGTITGNLSGATGCGSILDGLYIIATNTTTTANLNLCGTSYGLTAHGSPTFTADHGYTGNGSSAYLDTGFTPSGAGGNTSLDSATIGVYDLSNRAANGGSTEMGSGSGGPTSYTALGVLGSTNTASVEVNGSTFPNVTGVGTSNGLTAISRTSSSAFSLYKNASSTPVGSPSSTASASMPILPYYILAMSAGPTNFTSDQLSAAFFGGGVTGAQYLAISNRINAYMTALGINQY
jgi:hypothetical protein